MIDYEKLKALEEKRKANICRAGVSGYCVDVYEKAPTFYEAPRLIISTFIESLYFKDFVKCFDDNYIITKRNNVDILHVGSFLG